MNFFISFIISILIWLGMFYSFAYYVNTNSLGWEMVVMVFSMLSILMMTYFLVDINKSEGERNE